MRIILGKGRKRQSIEIPTGSNIGVTQEHVQSMCQIMQNNGVSFKETAKEQAQAA